ncbi:hypothetical protein AS19_27800 [Alcanivorax sp. NBRC 101098]|uniref:hypothetical protein n=1 Tax=Alcanivorax sp. NBRC 101098 TaxID=1113728 RepID=UPI0004ABE7EB|nr:hypothetical protein [Alcanivorax sp. NBRC 101098]BAP15631.1 hypothetical protein AS19_27800 [Alcanivorax sp. NBRC 101098]
MSNDELNLSEEESKIVQESLDKIKGVLKSKNIDIKNMIGLVKTDEVDATASQVDIRFAEDKMNVQMNMIAFD